MTNIENEIARQQTIDERELILSKVIHYSLEELDAMPLKESIKATLQVKLDETMMWQRKVAKLYYYLTITTLIVGGLAAFIFWISINK
jgi:hypothetical protein